MEKRAIGNIEDVQLLVNTFYGKVREDELLGPIFDGAIKERWPEHLDKMYRFWQTVLLQEHTYHGRPFPPHAPLPIEKAHFDRWLSLFRSTIQELFEGEKAEEALYRAGIMAEMFSSKMQFFKQTNTKPLL